MNATQYVISLPNFEGPLDLLLFFIKRDELDIYDIPISQITEEFLVYTHALQMLDLEQAGEFIVMAATLMQIKAKMLLPKPERGINEEEEEDPRAELVRRLIEYKQYKEIAEQLRNREEENRLVFYRQNFLADERVIEPETPEETLRNVTLFDLLTAFKKAVDRARKRKDIHVVERIAYTVEEQTDYILSIFNQRSQVTFFELIDRLDRMGIIVTMLALLELIKNKFIAFHQDDNFEDILLYKL
ncbi:MAG: segregation/condensation protein A [Chlorobi bacterium]|nr:MAG: segregation and condensation protein A [Chlorobi bacterium OLB7]MBK8911261.1 segregation/condensation protein A [Chlorobiota bacterium]MBX7217804.1 segregation/condensation protein A [Candidatus Kapabacteria bacterium]